jgi:hypothetical protein
MKRIQNFNEFVNEGYLQKIGETISGWYQSIKNAIKSGLMKIIPSGPKKGTPSYMVYTADGGSIFDQINNTYKGTEYYKMNNILDPSTITEAVIPTTFPQMDDVPDMSAEEIKMDIKRNLRYLLKSADAGKENVAFEIKPIFIYGSPGIGKTQIVAQVADEVGMELYGKPLNFVNVDGETSEPVDFSGVPKVIDVKEPGYEDPQTGEKFPYGKGVTRSNVNIDLLPLDNGKENMGGIIFIDELNRMPEQVIKVFMKLAQGRRIGQNYQIPSKWYIVAAGNRKEDDPRNVKELGTALRDRFDIVNYVPDVKSFRKYIETGVTKSGTALKDIVLPELLDFLGFQNEFFHKLDPDLKKQKYPTPRAWTDASFAVKRLMEEYGNKPIPDAILIREFQKSVGKEAAMAFVNFYKVAKTIPVKDLDLPYTNPDKAPLPTDRKGPKGGMDLDYRVAFYTCVSRRSAEIPVTEKEACNYTKWLTRCSEADPNAMDFGPASITLLFKNRPELKNNTVAIQCIAPLAAKWEMDLGINI